MTQAATPPTSTDDGRPNSHAVETENQRGGGDGKPPRPATEPVGAARSSQSSKTRTDPGSGRS
jgi:hypothetical protein